MALDKITTDIIADDAVTAAKIVAGAVEADIRADAIGTAELANDVVISTSGAITTTGAFTSIGIDDDANALAMTIDANENVGIGTATPTEKLHVRGTDNTRIQINSTGGNSQAALQLSNDAITYSIEIDDIDAASDSLYIRKDAGATPVFMISSAGNVGIGEVAPSAPLEITKTGAGVQYHLKLNNNRGAGQADGDGSAIVVEGAIQDNADATVYGRIECKFDDVSQGSIDSSWHFHNYISNNSTEVL